MTIVAVPRAQKAVQTPAGIAGCMVIDEALKQYINRVEPERYDVAHRDAVDALIADAVVVKCMSANKGVVEPLVQARHIQSVIAKAFGTKAGVQGIAHAVLDSGVVAIAPYCVYENGLVHSSAIKLDGSPLDYGIDSNKLGLFSELERKLRVPGFDFSIFHAKHKSCEAWASDKVMHHKLIPVEGEAGLSLEEQARLLIDCKLMECDEYRHADGTKMHIAKKYLFCVSRHWHMGFRGSSATSERRSGDIFYTAEVHITDEGLVFLKPSVQLMFGCNGWYYFNAFLDEDGWVAKLSAEKVTRAGFPESDKKNAPDDYWWKLLTTAYDAVADFSDVQQGNDGELYQFEKTDPRKTAYYNKALQWFDEKGITVNGERAEKLLAEKFEEHFPGMLHRQVDLGITLQYALLSDSLLTALIPVMKQGQSQLAGVKNN